jgi:hypothetical protein
MNYSCSTLLLVGTTVVKYPQPQGFVKEAVGEDVKSRQSGNSNFSRKESKPWRDKAATKSKDLSRQDAKIFSFWSRQTTQQKQQNALQLHKRFSQDCTLLRHSTAEILFMKKRQ